MPLIPIIRSGTVDEEPHCGNTPGNSYFFYLYYLAYIYIVYIHMYISVVPEKSIHVPFPWKDIQIANSNGERSSKAKSFKRKG